MTRTRSWTRIPRLALDVTASPLDTRHDSSLVVLADVPVTLFGHPPTSARLEVEPRSRGWRTRKAAVPLAIGLAVTPVVALLPPHAPWALIAVATGGILARRKWKERYTIRAADARCPRCDADLPLSEGSRLRVPHPVTCPECGHEPVLEVSDKKIGDAVSESRPAPESRPASGSPLASGPADEPPSESGSGG